MIRDMTGSPSAHLLQSSDHPFRTEREIPPCRDGFGDDVGSLDLLEAVFHVMPVPTVESLPQQVHRPGRRREFADLLGAARLIGRQRDELVIDADRHGSVPPAK